MQIKPLPGAQGGTGGGVYCVSDHGPQSDRPTWIPRISGAVHLAPCAIAHAACPPTSTYSARLDGFGIGKPSSRMP
jgi:hypothetical protein